MKILEKKKKSLPFLIKARTQKQLYSSLRKNTNSIFKLITRQIYFWCWGIVKQLFRNPRYNNQLKHQTVPKAFCFREKGSLRKKEKKKKVNEFKISIVKLLLFFLLN